MTDQETLRVYDASVDEYAGLVADEPEGLRDFMSDLPKAAHVLDLGCGTGEAAKFMSDAGFKVDAVDGSAEMVRHVQETHGINARQMFFDELEGDNLYDGAWVSFSLLHAAKADFPTHLNALHRALKSGGRLTLGMKLGEGEHRDSIGRMYAYYTIEELEDHLRTAEFTILGHLTGKGKGLSGSVDPYAVISAHA